MVYSALSDDTNTESNFTSRKLITVTTDGVSTPANYQVKLTIIYESEMQADFNDIRFNTRSGAYIDYWIESHIASTSAIVWVELPNAITDPGSDTIWMYYGNPGLSDGGVGADTFLQYNGQTSTQYLKSLEISGSFIYESKIKFNDTYGIRFGLSNVLGMTDDDVYIYIHDSLGRLFACENENVETYEGWFAGGISTDTYYDMRLVHSGSGVKFYIDDGQVGNEITTNLPDENMGMFLNIIGGTSTQDHAFVHKYIVNEPTPSYGTAQQYTDVLYLNGSLVSRWMESETIDSISIGAKTFKCSLENTDNAITNSYESFDTAVIYIDGTTVFNGRIEEIIPNESEATIELAGKDYMGDLIGEYIIENYGISQDMSNNEAAGSDVVIEITDTTGFEVADEIKVEDDNDAETAVITAVVANTSITVATLANSYTTAANAKVTVGRPGSYIVNDLVLKYGSSMTRVGIQTSTNKFIILFKGITAFDAIQYISDSEEFEFGQDQEKDFFYQPRTFEDSGLSIDLDQDDVMDYSFPRPGYEIINRVDIYGGTSGGVQVAIRVEDPTSQNYYGIIKGMTIIDEKITTELQAQARANAILSEKAWVIQIGELSVLGYETLQAGQLVSLSNFDSIDDGSYLVTEKMHLEPPGNTLIKVAEYRAELEDVIIDLLKRMRAREKEAMDEDAFQTKFLNFYVTSLNADVLVNVIKVDINDGYIAAHKTNSLAGRGYDGVGGNQLKAGRYQTETVII